MIPDLEHMPMDGSRVRAMTALLDKGSELEPTPDSFFPFGVKADPDIVHTFESLAERCGYDHKAPLGTDGPMNELDKFNLAKLESHIGFVRTKRGPIPYNMSYVALILEEDKNYLLLNVIDDMNTFLSTLKYNLMIAKSTEQSRNGANGFMGGMEELAFLELLRIAGFSQEKINEINKLLAFSESHRKRMDDINYKTENLLANESAIRYLVEEIGGKPKTIYCPSWPLGYDGYHRIRKELVEKIIGLEKWIHALPPEYQRLNPFLPENRIKANGPLFNPKGVSEDAEQAYAGMQILTAMTHLRRMRWGLHRIEERCQLLRPYQGEQK